MSAKFEDWIVPLKSAACSADITTFVPLPRRYCAFVVAPARAFNAACCVVCPVPPAGIPSVPVMSAAGTPVWEVIALVPLPLRYPLAASVAAPVPPFATGNVPDTSLPSATVADAVMAFVPLALTNPVSVAAPVPPLATGSVPAISATGTVAAVVIAAVPFPFR